MKRILLLLSSFILLAYGCSLKKTNYEKLIHDPLLYSKTMHQLTDVIIYDIFTPPVASRIYAYATMASYEVLANSPKNNYPSLSAKLGIPTVPKPAPGLKIDFPFASLMALTTVGKAMTFSTERMSQIIDTLKLQAIHAGMPKEVMDHSIKYGQQVAQVILDWSKQDHYAQTRGAQHTISLKEGHWTPTPPGYFPAVEPQWSKIRPLVMDSANMFAPPPPPAFSTDKNSAFYKMVYEVYSVVKNLTKEQKWIADFWDCNAFKLNVNGHAMFATKAMSPGGHWMEITGTIAQKAQADFAKTAYSYAMVSIAIFDGFISCWEAKYHWDLIRPETYINRYIDEHWSPYLQTPPFPEYTSGHSAISSAAATVLTNIYGNNFAYRDSSERPWGWRDRSYPTIQSAAQEVSMSRMYGGIHCRPALDEAMKQGRKIGELLMQKMNTN